ncbi:obscurin isoform X4 [Anoplophora glabripennis]|uniref:obscurin isoform X4 n=1 Tax=Anoplophora glabripennis TaxID=217634 RepID=UPI000874A42C|nr:obscurin isoform X4 [Anoplophora glabripennis]
MASNYTELSNVTGEILIAWQAYVASNSDELTLKEGDIVELLDTKDPVSSAKRIKLDPDLDAVSAELLDNSAARHKLSVKPKRRHASSRHSPTRLNINQRWLVREVSGGRRQGWVPCKILQTADDPALGTTGLPGDAEFRRRAVIKELVETEQEFVRDLDQVVQNYLIPTESGKVPKVIKNNFDVVFGNLKEIAEFHRTVLMEGVKYYAKEPLLLGKTFLRLERDFDKHVHYCRDEPLAQEFLDTCDEAYDYFAELTQRLGDDKTISEHLKLPIQRINDYQLLLKELVRYSACLGENNSDLQKALDLMLSVPHRAQDDKFTSSIEGYRGSIHKLGRLLAHDRFSITFGDITKERYLFLFKARILICKVRRISEDRSIFQLKDTIRLTHVELKDHPDDNHVFELVDKVGGQSLILKIHRNVKEFWLKEIREFASDYGDTDETVSDEFLVESALTENSQTNKEADSLSSEKQPAVLQKPTEQSKPQAKPPDIQVEESDQPPAKKFAADPTNQPKPDQLTAAKPKLPGQTKEQERLVQELKSAVVKTKLESKVSEQTKELKSEVKPKDQLVQELKVAVAKTEAKPTTKVVSKVTEQTKVQESKPEAKPKVPDHTKEQVQLVQELKVTVAKTEAKPTTKVEAKVTEQTKDQESKPDIKPKVPGQTKEQARLVQELKVLVAKTEVKSTTKVESKETDQTKGQELKSEVKPKVSNQTKVQGQIVQELKVAVTKTEAKPTTKVESKVTEQAKQQELKPKVSGQTKEQDQLIQQLKAAVANTDIVTKQYRQAKVQIEVASTNTSSSSDRTLVPEPFPTAATTTITTTDVLQSEDSTLKQIQTPESEAAEEHHLPKIQAVEPLVQINKPRVLEEVVPYVVKPPPELVPGSAVDKLYSVEKSGVSDVVLTDFKVGVEVNVEVGDDMSRRYTSSARSEGGYESSYSRRAGQSPYSSDALSSRYSTETGSSKYGTEIGSSKYGIEIGSSKYGTEIGSSKYGTETGSSKYGTDTGLSKYGTDSALTGGSKYDDYTSKYSKKSYSTDIGDTSSYNTRKPLTELGDNEYSYSRKSIRSSATGDDDSSYSKRSSRSITRTSGETGDADSYYSRRSLKTSLEGVGDGDGYAIRKSIKTSVEGTGIEPSETNETYSYSSKLGLGSDIGSKYAIRSTSAEDADGSSKYTRRGITSRDDDEEALMAKYSPRYSLDKRALGEEEEDKYAKYSRKYAKTETSTERKSYKDDEDNKYSRKYSRADSKDKKRGEEEEDAYEKYARKYLRKEASVDVGSKTEKAEPEEDVYAKYSRKYSRTDSSEKKSNKEDVNGKEAKSDLYESKEFKSESREAKSESKSTKTESYSSETRSSQAREEKSESRSSQAKEERSETRSSQAREEKSETRSSSTARQSEASKEMKSESYGSRSELDSSSKTQRTAREKSAEEKIRSETYGSKSEQDSISLTMRSTREKSAEEKLEELDDKPKFIKTIRGASVEPGETAYFEVSLSKKPASLLWLKDNKPINGTKDARIETATSGQDCKLIIRRVKEEDAGIYSAIAQNEKGKSSCSAQLIVHALTTEERTARVETDKPEFLVSMKDAELLEDTYLRFMVKVAGEPNPEVTFYKDGTKIPENTERYQVIREHSDSGFYELIIPVVKKSDAGLYKCIAKNKFGESTSEATVTVTENKQIFEDMPEGEILPPGEKPVFHWKKDGAPFEPEERFKVLMGDDEDSLALVFQKVRPDDVGLYTCVAQTSRGHISCSAELTVHGTVNQLFREPEKPSLTIIKKNPIVNVGGSAMLELQVKGYPKPSVKWTHEGKTIEASSKYKLLYEDEESMSLVIKNVQSDDAGIYTFTAENELGSDTAEMKLTVKVRKINECFISNERQVHIIAPPKIKTKMEDVSVHADILLKMDVEVEGIPKPTVQFYKDGKIIKESDRIKIEESGEKHTLVIEKTSLKDTGSYSVVATNELAQVSQFWNLDVYSKPKVLEKLGADKVVSQGENLELKLKLESEPKPTVKWYKDEEEIKSDEHYVIKDDGDVYMLRITGAVTTDAARFKCKAVNIHGSVDDDVVVNVKKAPKITKGLQNMTVKEHDNNVTFDVKLEAFPQPTVKWYLDEVEIQETRTEFTRQESHDGVQLVIKEVTSELSGQYTCKLSNECGSAETSAKLTVNCAPRIIKQLEDVTVEEGATLHLEVEVDGCPPPTVKWLRNGREVSADARIKISKDKHRDETYNLAVDLIKYEEQGEYEVIVTNCMGTVSSKSIVTVQKVTHTDAIEELEEPPKKVKFEVLEDEPEEPKPKEKPKGTLTEIEVKESSIKSPEPIVEEPPSPKVLRRASSTIIEEVEQVDIDEDAHKPKDVEETILEQKKPKRGISVQIEEVETVESKADTPTPAKEEDLPRPSLKKGVSATKEDIDLIEDEDIQKTPKTPIETDIDANKKLKRGVSASVENADLIEDQKEEPQTPLETDVDSARQLRRGISAKKETIEVVEDETTKPKTPTTIADEPELAPSKAKRAVIEDRKEVEIDEEEIAPRKIKEETLERQESQKGKRDYDEEEIDKRTEELLRKAQKQRSLVEEITEKPSKAEAIPMILETNMKDGSRPESLDITYIVKGTANPPPEVTWLHDGKEIKPDSNLRVTTSQKGEEFRLEIKKLDLKDSGVYQCVLKNPVGDVKQQAVLDVTPERDLRRPKIKEGLKDQSVVKKNTVTFKAVVIGDPVPDAAWLHNGKEMTEEDFENNKIILETEDQEIEDGLNECTYKLTIPRCDVSNTGKYTIKPKNKWGECESSAKLTIVMRPEIEGPEDVTVVPGEATEFTIVVQANPEPQVIWYKNDQPIQASDLIKIVEDRANETYKLVFHKVMLADEGYYKVTASNELGEASSEARLKTVKETEPTTERPKFITGLVDEQVEHQGEIAVMVRADGLPKPEIRWYCNGKPIEEDAKHKIETQTEKQVTSKLTITDFDEANTGIYKAVATNIVGEAGTTSRISMLQTPPSFGKKLDKNLDVNEGEPLELKAKINGSPKPVVEWFKDGEPVPVKDDSIKTSTLPDGTVKLNIERCKPSDSGAYKLVVKNPNGETACLCAVAVTPKPKRPKFLKCFKDTKLPIGETLRLEAKVEAYPPPEIKWLKDGIPVRPSSNVHTENYPDGRVALVVDIMKPDNAGNYQLIVSNKLGEAVGEAKVEVERKPTKPDFIQRLAPQTVVEGFPVKLEVKAEGFPAPKITWTRNGAEVISDNKHIKIIEQPDGSSALLLDAADVARDALTYKAIASNEAGESDTSAPLTVKPSAKPDEPEERPMFLHALRDVLTDEGEPLILEAPFTGNPIPSVEWTKDGEPIVPSERILLTCDGRRVGLKIDHSVPSDAGVYGVTIINPLGKESTKGKATVRKVFMPPSFTQRFTDLQQLPGRDAKFPCRVSGVPQPEVTWSKDGVPLRNTDKYHIKRDGDLCCLYVADCDESDVGVYTATATNREGQAECTATLDVVKEIKSPQKIEPPVFLKRIGDTELFKAMTAKFTACASGIPEPNVEWFHNDQKIFPSTRIKMDKDTAGLLRLTISGVDEDDLGKYTCKISNEHGSDICHAYLKFDEGIEPKPKRPITDQYTEFDKYKKSGAPMPISDPPIISQMTDRHCTLSWKPSIPSGPRAPVTYQLEMCELPSGDWFTVRSGIRSCTCGVRNLEPFRNYKFRVRVENKYGISDPSPFAITHRDKLEPELPKFRPYLPPEIDFRPETSPYFPKDFDIERPPHDGMAQAPRFLRREHDTQYGIKDQNSNLFWFVYGYPKPKMTYYFNDELIEPGGRFDMSYTRNGQATLFINKMLERDVGWYEAVAKNEHGEARQRVRLEIAELPYFIRRPEIEYVMLRGKARFQARIVGVPYPEIKWYKDWKPLAASSRIKIAFIEPDTTVLTINDVILKDEGLYSVSARNVAGTVSSSAMLHVEENEHEYRLRNYTNLSPIKTKKRLYTDLYDIGDELGRGTQGVTYHAVERLNGRNYAAKIMHGSGDLRPFMYNELDMLNELRHKKLISLYDSYENEDCLALILELGAGGELVKDYLLKQDYYTESDIAGFMRQLLQGLDYMHDRGYGHMGLNLGDLLISHPGGDDLKITDFSLTRRIEHGNYYPLKYGMPEYVSPEVINGDGVGYGQDMWSVGIMTYILLSGRSPFRGANDRETLTNIREGRWTFDDSWWSRISVEGKDFISRLLVYDTEGRMNVRDALRHPWLEKADKRYQDEFQIRSTYLSDYWRLYREWYDNASCRRWFRRRPLEGAFTHPSKMVYPPGEYYSPRATPAPLDKTARTRTTWEDQLPTRSPLNYEIGVIKSESHYQNGPDTYLLQLRDVDFPVRLREYMKVAANRGPGSGYIVSDENGYDWGTPIIRERRRFTDIMDEEIDDERKARINRYGAAERDPTIRRLRHEIGARLDTYVEAEAFLESKQDGRLPFFREKPKFTAMVEGKDLELTCLAVGEPQPIVQWFKNDAIVAESHRVKIITDAQGRSHLRLSPALGFDQGMYKVVARNKVGQTIARTRIVLGLVPDEPDSPEASQISDTEILLTWKQPKFDGNAPVICYRLEYKLADETEWTKKAANIDHEFYLIGDLEPSKSYIFRLAARNSIGWSDAGVPSAAVTTKPSESPKIKLTKAMFHLQQITDSGKEVEEETKQQYDYQIESNPVEWEDSNVEELYDFISEIYRGRFSHVLKAANKLTDDVVVAKIFDYKENRRHDVDGEFAALRSLRHERIASLLAAYRTTDTAVFILEKLQGADILTYLASKHEYTEQTVATIVTQILDGIQYLHWRGLCHLDLQPDNVVMSGVRSVQVKLVDLGAAHRVTKLGTKVPIVGHPDYISPEVLAEEPAFPQSDIWTIGVLTYIMLSGTVPFRGQDENESRQNILFVRYRFEHLYQEVTQEATRFLMLLFKRHPNKRPSPEECHENRWLLPTDYMIKKRERAVFLGHRIKEYSEEYHNEKTQLSQKSTSSLGAKLIKTHSIQEELLTAP